MESSFNIFQALRGGAQFDRKKAAKEIKIFEVQKENYDQIRAKKRKKLKKKKMILIFSIKENTMIL